MQMLYSSPVVYGAPAMPQAPQGYPGYGQQGLYPNGMPMQPQPAPQIQQPQQVQQTQPPPLKGWQVSSQEEARKAMIDPDGSLFVFPDVSTGAIYTKQINPVDFSAVFRIYHIAQAIPDAATINAPVVITIGTGTVQYPLTRRNCAQVTACSLRTTP